MSNEVATTEKQETLPMRSGVSTLDVVELVDLVAKVRAVKKSVMKEGEHYGTIPGTEKPTIYKSGVELLNMMFRMAPKYIVKRGDLENGHREYEVACELYHIHTGEFLGSGVGLCSTMEKKYRYRQANRACPECGSDAALRKSRKDNEGWYCWGKIGGCGAKFTEADKRITGQDVGMVENPDIADMFNTVLKMAKKRSHADATLTVTGGSDLFTQDVEDMDLGQSAKPEGENVSTQKAQTVEDDLPPAGESLADRNSRIAKGQIIDALATRYGTAVDKCLEGYDGLIARLNERDRAEVESVAEEKRKKKAA